MIESLETIDYFTQSYSFATSHDHFKPSTFNFLAKLQSNSVKCGGISSRFPSHRPCYGQGRSLVWTCLFSAHLPKKYSPQPNHRKKQTNENKTQTNKTNKMTYLPYFFSNVPVEGSTKSCSWELKLDKLSELSIYNFFVSEKKGGGEETRKNACFLYFGSRPILKLK